VERHRKLVFFVVKIWLNPFTKTYSLTVEAFYTRPVPVSATRIDCCGLSGGMIQRVWPEEHRQDTTLEQLQPLAGVIRVRRSYLFIIRVADFMLTVFWFIILQQIWPDHWGYFPGKRCVWQDWGTVAIFCARQNLTKLPAAEVSTKTTFIITYL